MSDVIVVSERRRSWPDDLKLQILAEAEQPGENVCRVARRHEIDPAQVYQWRKKFRDQGSEAMRLMPVEITEEATALSNQLNPVPLVTTDEKRIEIALKNGRHLFAPADIDLKRLSKLVAILEAA